MHEDAGMAKFFLIRNNAFFCIMGVVFDLMMVNLLMLLYCLPIVTAFQHASRSMVSA